MQCFNVAGASEFSNICTHKTLALPSTGEKKEAPPPELPEPTDNSDRDVPYIVLGVVLAVVLIVLTVSIVLCNPTSAGTKEGGRRARVPPSDHNSNLQQNGHIGNGEYFTALVVSNLYIHNQVHWILSSFPSCQEKKYAAVIGNAAVQWP
uniref:Putative brother of cdo n=1 Tax=Ixodes ricinus TaxID=34613 RepID=A0A0K8RLU7_IXORI